MKYFRLGFITSRYLFPIDIYFTRSVSLVFRTYQLDVQVLNDVYRLVITSEQQSCFVNVDAVHWFVQGSAHGVHLELSFARYCVQPVCICCICNEKCLLIFTEINSEVRYASLYLPNLSLLCCVLFQCQTSPLMEQVNRLSGLSLWKRISLTLLECALNWLVGYVL